MFANTFMLCSIHFVMAMCLIATNTSTTNDAESHNTKRTNTTTSSNLDAYHNSSILLNLRDVMAMRPEDLPTIDESYYTNLVTRHSSTEQFVMDIPQELEDAYNIGDQYVKRLQNRGQLPPDFQAHKVKRNQPTFDPILFRLTAYDCNKPTNIKI